MSTDVHRPHLSLAESCFRFVDLVASAKPQLQEAGLGAWVFAWHQNASNDLISLIPGQFAIWLHGFSKPLRFGPSELDWCGPQRQCGRNCGKITFKSVLRCFAHMLGTDRTGDWFSTLSDFIPQWRYKWEPRNVSAEHVWHILVLPPCV